MLRAWRWFTHDLLGWHDGQGGSHSFDGLSFGGTCSVCGCRVLLDSQGNWFRVGSQDG